MKKAHNLYAILYHLGREAKFFSSGEKDKGFYSKVIWNKIPFR